MATYKEYRMTSVLDQLDNWAQQAQIWSIWLLTTLSTALAISGIVFFWFDVRTSYFGWGKLAETHTTVGESSIFLAVAISLLPTLFQAAWVVANRSPISNHRNVVKATVKKL